MNKELNDNENKRLMAASVYLNLYMGMLEEFVDKSDGDIYLHEYGNRYAMFWIRKKFSKCWVDRSFWDKFSEEFSLQENEIQSIITRWVKDTYKLVGIQSLRYIPSFVNGLKIPTN